MAPAIIYFMNYTVWFSDKAEYDDAMKLIKANSGGLQDETGALLCAPKYLIDRYAIPYPTPDGGPSENPKGFEFTKPYVPGEELIQWGYRHTGVILTITSAFYTQSAINGDPRFALFQPDTVNWVWAANLKLNQEAGAANSPSATAMAQRRWIGGRELMRQLEGGSPDNLSPSRDASRTIDGFGFALRGTSITNWSRNVNQYRTGFVTKVSWERLYIRVRVRPATIESPFWRTHGASSSTGFILKMNTAGMIRLYASDSAGTETSRGDVITPEINVWYRLDMLIKYENPASSGLIKVFLNGTEVASGAAFGNDASHTSSEIGRIITVSDDQFELDLDDWINSDLPGHVDPATLNFNGNAVPLDWALGSHVKEVHIQSITSTGAWTPALMAKGVMNLEGDPSQVGPTVELQAVATGTTLEGITDALPNGSDATGLALGPVAAVVGFYGRNGSSGTGKIGYKVAGGAAVTTDIAQGFSYQVYTALYAPTGKFVPEEITPFSVLHSKTANANNCGASFLRAAVEYLGVWGPEDDTTTVESISRLSYLHNCRYGNSQFGYFFSAPEAPVFARGGQYIGNGTYQEIQLPGPVHFVFIRNVTAGNAPLIMFGASIGAHIGPAQAANAGVRTWYDSFTNTYKLSVTGDHASFNAASATYQIEIFCDPRMRFSLCGAFAHGNLSTVPRANPLIAEDFNADCGFAQRDHMNSLTSSVGLWFKGPGNSGITACALDGSAVEPNFGNFAPGVFNNGSALRYGGAGGFINFSLWRMADSGGSASGGCGGPGMVQILSYTGNGAASRSVALTPASQAFPLLVMVMPVTNAVTFYRDPAHTGLNSSNFSTGGLSTVAITAVAMDSITVGTALNANGVVYNIFSICGDAAGMNNGQYQPSDCSGDGPYIEPEVPDTNPVVIGNGGLDLGATSSGVPITLLKDIGGIYTIIPLKRNDSLIDRQTGQTNVDVEIPDPSFKTGYVGG
jgi:hypothetical protein